MTLRANLPAWLQMAKANIRLMFMYRFNVFMGIVLTAVTIYLLTIVWTAAYGARETVDGISLRQALVYLTIANLQLYFLQPQVSGTIQERIREGQIGFDLTRPVSFPSQLVARAAGDMVGLLPMMLLAVPIAFVLGELRPPASVAAGLGYAASFLLAWIVAVQLNMLIGLVSFWTLETTGFAMMYRLIGNFATGALVPLWFMPDLLRAFVQLLPFQSIAYVPVSIYVGAPATGALWSALGLQLFWSIAMVFVIRLVWNRAFRHTVIQGG